MTKKFRRRPEVIEAAQYQRPSPLSLIDSAPGVCQCEQGSMRGHVHTSRAGLVIDVQPGDWIIKDGEHFDVCADGKFQELYEPAEVGETREVLHAAVEMHRAGHNHLAEVFRIVEGATRSDFDKVNRYARLLADKLEEDNEPNAARWLRRILDGKAGARMIPHEQP